MRYIEEKWSRRDNLKLLQMLQINCHQLRNKKGSSHAEKLLIFHKSMQCHGSYDSLKIAARRYTLEQHSAVVASHNFDSSSTSYFKQRYGSGIPRTRTRGGTHASCRITSHCSIYFLFSVVLAYSFSYTGIYVRW
jgi:hypothetical protein